ncbi:MAG: CvpA family protein [Desulfovibrionaceae bacterium]
MTQQYMNYLDVILILLILLFIFRGAYTGFVKQMSMFLGIFLGMTVSAKVYMKFVSTIQIYFSSTSVASLVSYIIVFIAIYLLVTLLGGLLKRFLSIKIIGWLDHLVGGIMGFIIALLVSSVLLIILQKFHVSATGVEESVLAPHVERSTRILNFLLPDSLTERTL